MDKKHNKTKKNSLQKLGMKDEKANVEGNWMAQQKKGRERGIGFCTLAKSALSLFPRIGIWQKVGLVKGHHRD
jgi:hypothetical protein